MDNPRIKQEEPSVKTPRAFRGSQFSDFPKLVVQINSPRPRRERVEKQPATPEERGGEPSEGFARPLRGMGVGRYEGAREQFQPQIDSYRKAVHDAYADNVLTDEERQGLRQQRRGLRMDVRQYKRQHPLQMGLGQKLGLQRQEGDLEDRISQEGQQVTGRVPSFAHLQQLQEQWRAGKLTPQQILEALGFTGRLPNG